MDPIQKVLQFRPATVLSKMASESLWLKNIPRHLIFKDYFFKICHRRQWNTPLSVTLVGLKMGVVSVFNLVAFSLPFISISLFLAGMPFLLITRNAAFQSLLS